MDLTMHLSHARIARLSEEQKAELRRVVKKEFPQKHFLDNRVAWRRNARAASGAREWIVQRREEKNEKRMRQELDAYAEPIPTLADFIAGIPHFNSEGNVQGRLWNVVRALASKKVHYRSRLQHAVWPHDGGCCAVSGCAPFREAYPNAVLDDGFEALTPEAFQATLRAAGIKDEDEYTKHLLNKHDGEVRHWGAFTWRPVPSDSVEALRRLRFWHVQFAKTSKVRRWLDWFRGRDDGELTWEDIEWTMKEEGGETTLLKCDSASSSASGGGRKWHIKSGHRVTLAEVFNHGCHLCSCHSLYRMYVLQPMLVYKMKKHSNSQAPGRRKLEKAKKLHLQLYGRRTLPWHPW